MDLRRLAFNIDFKGDASPVENMNKAADKLKNSAKSAVAELDKMGKSMTKMGKGMMTKVTAPIVALGTASIATVAKFDDSMSQVQAVTQATEADFKEMRDMAKDLGATTAHSASSAADGMSILAASGKDTNEILAMTPDLLSLASAGGLELEQTAGILSGTMAMFNLESKDTQRITDVLAKAASSSNTNIGEMGSAMDLAGGSAYSMNMDIEKTNAVLGIFANQNLTGTRAGTTFTAMFSDLSKGAKDGAIAIGKSSVSVYDASGAMRDMGSIMADVEGATKGMSDAQRDSALQGIFGIQSMKGVNAMLTEGADKYNELEGAIYNSEGAAAQMAEDMENNIGGAFRSMKSAIEGFMIELGDSFKDDVAKIAGGIGKLAGVFGKLSEPMKRAIVIGGAVAAAIGPIIFIVGSLITKVIAMGPAFAAVKGALVVLTGSVGWIIAGVIALIAVITHLWKTNEVFRDIVLGIWESIKNSLGAAIEFIQNLWETHGESIKTTLMNVFDIVKNIVVVAMTVILGVITVVLGYIQLAWMLFGDTLMTIIGVAWETIQSVISGAMNVIQGIIDIVLGVISGNWGQAWEGMKQVFGGIFEALGGIAKGAMNGVIAIINGAIGGLNKIKLPDWLPGKLGGKGINIPLIPQLAKGTNNWAGGIAQVHEKGGEIIDLPGGSRVYPHDESVEMARKQGQEDEGSSGIVFSPTYNVEIHGTATEEDKEEIENIMRRVTREMFDQLFKEMMMKFA